MWKSCGQEAVSLPRMRETGLFLKQLQGAGHHIKAMLKCGTLGFSTAPFSFC